MEGAEFRCENEGLNNYLYYFGGSLLQIEYNIAQNPILIIQASTSLLL